VLGAGRNNPDDPIHKKLFAATDRASDVFNDKLKNLNETVKKWEEEFHKAHSEGNEKGKEVAESKRSEFTTQREALMLFKTRLGRFVRVYNYIAQLIELSDADLENFAAYARLLSKRLKGVSPESIDLSGLVLKGYAIQKRNGDVEGEAETLKPLTANDSDANDREKQFLDEILSRINDEFGGATPENSVVFFVSQVYSDLNTDRNRNVIEQVKNNTRETALSGDIGDAVRNSVVRMMTSNMDKAQTALSDAQKMDVLVGVMVDIIQSNSGNDIIDSMKSRS
jgi:type I restriction enzyme R subunit